MDFLVQNIGWFAGIGLVLLLSLIGYYADKKDKKEKPVEVNVNKEETNENVIEERPSTVVVTNTPNENVTLKNTHEENFGINIPEFKNIEDTHMSMEDLEKANYDAIVNHSSYNTINNDYQFDGISNSNYENTNSSPNTNNEYESSNNDNISNYQDIEGGNSLVINNANNYNLEINGGHEFDNEVYDVSDSMTNDDSITDIYDNNINTVSNNDDDNQALYGFENEVQELGTNYIDDIPTNADNNSTNEMPNVDNNITNETQNINKDDSSEVFFTAKDINSLNNIPELTDTIPVNDSSLNSEENENNSYLSDDDIDDDIWKF